MIGRNHILDVGNSHGIKDSVDGGCSIHERDNQKKTPLQTYSTIQIPRSDENAASLGRRILGQPNTRILEDDLAWQKKQPPLFERNSYGVVYCIEYGNRLLVT